VKFGLLLIGLSMSAQVFAADVVCESGKDQRKLVITDVDKGCKLEYTKSGETKEIANQKNGKNKCEETLAHVKDKLEKSNFKCSE